MGLLFAIRTLVVTQGLLLQSLHLTTGLFTRLYEILVKLAVAKLVFILGIPCKHLVSLQILKSVTTLPVYKLEPIQRIQVWLLAFLISEINNWHHVFVS